MTQIRLCWAIAMLTCLTGFNWPVDDTSSATPDESTDAADTLTSRTIDDRVVRLQELAHQNEITDATLSQVREGLFSPVEELRAAALNVIGAHGQHSDEQLLIRLLSDSSDDVQVAAAQAIRSFGSRATAVALAGLLDDQSADVRVATLKTLGEFAQPATTFPVLDLLLSHDARVEMAAIRALGQIRDPRALPALAVRLESENYAASLAASEALVSMDTVDSVRAVLARAVGLRQYAMGNSDMGAALALASPQTVVDAILAEGGSEVVDHVLMSVNLPSVVIRMLYAEFRESVPFDQLPERLKTAAIVWGVDDERLDSSVFLEQSYVSSMVTPQEGETLEDSCVAERANSDFSDYGYGNDEYGRPKMSVYDQAYALRSVFLICGPDHTAAAVGLIPAKVAAPLIRDLSPDDSLREWLLSEGATWDDGSDDAEPAWTLFAALSESSPAELRAYGSLRLSDAAIEAALAYGWGRRSFAAFLGMLSDEAQRTLPATWRSYASHLADDSSRDGADTTGSTTEQLAALQVAISQCSPLSNATEQSIDRDGSRWTKNLRDLHTILCHDVASERSRAQALDRRRVTAMTNNELEFAPGENADQLAGSLWQAAVSGDLTAEDIDQCVRYSLGEAPQSVRTACLLAAERVGGIHRDSELMLDNLRRRSSSWTADEQAAAGDQTDERSEHMILISDRATGRGVWGAPLLLFLNDGTTIETTAGAYGFLAVPSSIISGVSPK